MIITFYSFKGGVGRSMAMAACAYLFAQRGLRTLAIDFDLEAPGLERYFFDDPSQLAQIRASPGLIDLVLAYKRALTNEAEFERADFKQWQRFVADVIHATPAGGSVDLMTAGSREPEARYAEYALAVRSFDWQDFFHNWRGDRFFDWLRRELTAVDKGYDVVLVDSRTGVTEMGGVCAYQLASVAVLLCAANYQNLDGVRAIVDDFRSDAVTVVRQGRPIEILVVPARVEDDNQAIASQREQFFVDFERRFGSDGMPKVLADAGLNYRNLALKYHPELAIIERLVDSEMHARASFERLTDALTLMGSGARWDPLRQEAFARLTGQHVEHVAMQADATKRGAGYDVLMAFGPSDAPDAHHLTDQLTRGGVNVGLQSADVETGEDWSVRALEYSAAFAIALGRSDPTRTYWNLFREAQVRRKQIVPILLPVCDNPEQALAMHGLSDYQACDLRQDVGTLEAVELLRAALGTPAHTRPAGATDASSVTPYPGPDPFSEDQSPYFFGREADCDRVLAAFSDHDVVILSGASGVGKTSLIHAGLVPRVRRGEGPFGQGTDASPWHVKTIDLAGQNLDVELDQIAAGAAAQRVLYIVDSLDSFASNGDEQAWHVRRDGVARLLDVAGPQSKFLLAWRELLPDAERTDTVRRWSRRGPVASVTLEPLPPQSIREVIEKPASREGHLLEPGLSDRLISDCGLQPGAVAQLQLALGEIWIGRRRGWLTNKAYDAAGGIGGRYGRRLEALLGSRDTDLGGAVAILLKQLLEFDRSLHAVPQPREWTTLTTIPALTQSDPVALRERLTSERIIDVWRRPSGELLCGLSHPTIPKALKELAAADAAFVLWRQRLASYVRDFTTTKGSTASLLGGDILGEAERWLGTHGEQLAADERSLIEQSATAQTANERRQRRRSVASVAFALVVMMGSGAAAIFLWQRTAYETQVAEATSSYVDFQRKYLEALNQQEQLRARTDQVEQKLESVTNDDDKVTLEKELTRLNDTYAQRELQTKDFEEQLRSMRQGQVLATSENKALLKQIEDLRNELKAAVDEREQFRQAAAWAENMARLVEATAQADAVGRLEAANRRLELLRSAEPVRSTQDPPAAPQRPRPNMPAQTTGSADTAYARGVQLFERKNWKEAARYLKEAVDLQNASKQAKRQAIIGGRVEPWSPQAYLAVALIEDGNCAEAAGPLKQAASETKRPDLELQLRAARARYAEQCR